MKMEIETFGLLQNRTNRFNQIPRHFRKRVTARHRRGPIGQVFFDLDGKRHGGMKRTISYSFNPPPITWSIYSAETFVQRIEKHCQIGFPGIARPDEYGKRAKIDARFHDRAEILHIDSVTTVHDGADFFRRRDFSRCSWMVDCVASGLRGRPWPPRPATWGRLRTTKAYFPAFMCIPVVAEGEV